MLRFIFSAVLLFSFLLSPLTSNAKELTEAQKLNIREKARNYYLQQEAKQDFAIRSLGLDNNKLNNRFDRRNDCDPDNQSGPSCVSILCETTHCSGSNGKEIAEACRGSSGRCVAKLCETTHCSGSNGREIAQACKGSSGLCTETLCETTHCSGSNGKEIAKACMGSDGHCVQELCKTTHCSGSNGKEIAQACAGN